MPISAQRLFEELYGFLGEMVLRESIIDDTGEEVRIEDAIEQVVRGLLQEQAAIVRLYFDERNPKALSKAAEENLKEQALENLRNPNLGLGRFKTIIG
ncbi:MAG TPA: hypothetical protein VFE94_02780 [Candidatus Paceibacterota bacterium]|nr:hypothetical protein [Candidatus Paceibacterota bacterium]